MKEVWRCQWETIPDDGEQVEVFPTLAVAKRAMRQKISQCVDLREYLPDLDPEAAKYLGSFLSDPEFPRSEEDVPEDYEEPEHGELSLDSNWIFWEYPCDAYPYLRTDLVTTKQNGDSYEFEFRYNYPVIYEASFSYVGNHCAVDILRAEKAARTLCVSIPIMSGMKNWIPTLWTGRGKLCRMLSNKE